MLNLPAAILLLAGLASGDDLLEGYRLEIGPFGRLYHRGWNDQGRESLVSRITETIARVEERLERRLEREIIAVLVPDQGELARLTTPLTGRPPPDWVVGLALPEAGWILVRGDLPPADLLDRDRPGSTIVHEIAHLVIHRRRGVSIPRWFDEGVAMWVAGERIPPRDEAFLSGLARLDGLFSVRELEDRFPGHHQPGNTAYQQSLLMVRYLAQRHGDGLIIDLLDALEAGRPFGEAYRTITAEDWSAFEPDFRAWVADRRSLIEVMGLLLDVWILIILLSVVAMVCTILRRRQLRRRLEREELEESRGIPVPEGF